MNSTLDECKKECEKTPMCTTIQFAFPGAFNGQHNNCRGLTDERIAHLKSLGGKFENGIKVQGNNIYRYTPTNLEQKNKDLAEQNAILQKQLQVSKAEDMLHQLVLGGPGQKTEMEKLEEEYQKLQLQIEIKEMQG